MSRVGEEQLLGLVGRVYDAAFEPQQWQGVAADLADLYAGTAALTTQDRLGVEAAAFAA